MPQVVVDILEGTATSHDLMGGWSVTRIAIVEGLNSGANLDTGAIILQAEMAVSAITGPRGWPCPNIGVNTFLQNFQTELLGPNAAKVKIIYKGYPLPVYEYDGSLNMVETNKDAFGDPVVLEYTYPATYQYDDMVRGKTAKQGGMVRTPMPESLYTIRWIVAPGFTIGGLSGGTLATQQMSWLKKQYEGKINNAPYTIGLLTGGPKEWLIEKVTGTSRDGGLTYEAAMTFHHKPNTWDQLVVFNDPHTGLPPPDLVDGVGSKIVQGFPAVTFPTFTFAPN